MKITKISFEHTRQVQPFTPAKFSVEAEVTENEDVAKAAKELQRFVIMVLYKDDIKGRDHLINTLVDCKPKVETPTNGEVKGDSGTSGNPKERGLTGF